MPDIDAITEDHARHLHALAEAAGVETAYHDIYGTRHEAGTEALIALLGAMGLPATTPEEAARSLTAFDAEQWSRPVPPVSVLRQGSEPFSVALVVPESALGSPLPWRLDLEDGRSREGTAEGAALPVEETTEDGDAPLLRIHLPLPDDLPLGYHRLTVGPLAGAPAGAAASGQVIVAPAACYQPPALADGGRVWGLGCQLYSLRAQGNWGMGDFADLSRLGARLGEMGGAVLGLNPLHALFLTKPSDASPYSPNSRLFLNPLYIALPDVPEFASCRPLKSWLDAPETVAALDACREAALVDYPAVATLKRPALEILFATFEADAPKERCDAFAAFLKEGGERLRLFAVFCVLQEAYADQPWPLWPEELRSPASPAVADFAAAHDAEVRFHLWLQFEADRQLGAACDAFAKAGGAVGLYKDLAVGANPDGADTWMDPDAYVRTARFGAPPDDLGPTGQDWGLPPLNPHGLKREAYGPFIDMLRANMRHAGALRIDHAMALQHLFWIPPGKQASDGIYVSYPMDDMMGILALESHRHQCLIIGEDLGTVPDGFRDRMQAENVLSYRIMFFERYENGLFKRPDAYPEQALATATSHDMATIPGNWEGWDIALRHRLGLTRPDQDEAADQAARGRDREALVAALADQGLLPTDFPTSGDLSAEQMTALVQACHSFLARTPAQVMLINMDDLAGEVTQVNVPGTVAAYPNWSRRLGADLEDLMQEGPLRETSGVLNQERGQIS